MEMSRRHHAQAKQVGDLLHVRWLDAHNYPTSWETLDTLECYVCEVQSVGWFIRGDDKQIILSADYSVDDAGDVMINTYFAIPTGCIIEKTVLRSTNG